MMPVLPEKYASDNQFRLRLRTMFWCFFYNKDQRVEKLDKTSQLLIERSDWSGRCICTSSTIRFTSSMVFLSLTPFSKISASPLIACGRLHIPKAVLKEANNMWVISYQSLKLKVECLGQQIFPRNLTILNNLC